MSGWKEFESRVFSYLRHLYSDDGKILFVKEGSSNSTKLDIKVIGKNKGELNLEVKSPSAQAGQFVLKRESGNFKFSPNKKNKVPTALQQELIEYINKNISTGAIKQNGIIIPYDKDKVTSLVREHYVLKGAHYFVTGSFELEKSIVVIPIDKLEESFSFQINLRRKKSGTSSIPKKYHDIGKCIAEKKIGELGLQVLSCSFNKKLIFKTDCTEKLKKNQLYFLPPNEHFFLSQKDDHSSFELKVRSSTNNINIVYSSEYNGKIDDLWEKIFIEDLRKL